MAKKDEVTGKVVLVHGPGHAAALVHGPGHAAARVGC
jgi:hypothetical protein